MLTIRLDEETENRLNRLAKSTNRSKSFYVREAILHYLEEQEDLLVALARIEDKPEAFLATGELWNRLGWSEDLQ